MMMQQLNKASGSRVGSNGSPAARISSVPRPVATAASAPTAPASTWDYWKSIQDRHPSSKVAGKAVEGDYKKWVRRRQCSSLDARGVAGKVVLRRRRLHQQHISSCAQAPPRQLWQQRSQHSS
ncbi:MAG: hypothetical protein WDW38_000040 [Sanguina aurantia]